MAEEYICRKAERSDIEKRWEYLTEIHPGSPKWERFRAEALEKFDRGDLVPFYGFLNGKIISELTAYVKPQAFENDISEPEGLLDSETAYLAAFRTDKEYQNLGYFSRLYRFAEKQLFAEGYRALTLGVEPSEARNLQIYFHLGFTDYVKTVIERGAATGDPKEETVLFYRKILQNTIK